MVIRLVMCGGWVLGCTAVLWGELASGASTRKMEPIFRAFGPDFARLTRLGNFAVSTLFRALARLAAKFRLLLTHARPVAGAIREFGLPR